MTQAMHLLGELRRSRRRKLKKKCYPKDASKEDVIKSKPAWADKQQYVEPVDYWFLPTMQVSLFSCSIIFQWYYTYDGVFEFTEYSLFNWFLCFNLLAGMCLQTLINMNKRSHGFQKDIVRSGPISFAQTADNMIRNALYNNQPGF